jgi:hypothetical protein
MAKSEQAYRDACRRQHRVIANYLAVEAWRRGLDCIVLVRSDMETLLGLERFKSARVAWMRSDFEPWFPYQEAYYSTRARDSIQTLFLSRVPISEHLSSRSMTTERRIALMGADAPRTKRFSGPRTRVPSEAQIVSRLAVLAAGLDVPKPRR